MEEKKVKIFSEVYSTYYHITEKILKKDKVTKDEIRNIIRKNGFSETMLFLDSKLTGNNGYGLLSEKNGIYQSILKKEPHMPLTTLEKRWLCAVVQDKKSGLFLNLKQREDICRLLGATPLYESKSYYFFDRFSDGDDYENEQYIKHFRDIILAIHDQTLIIISFQTRKGKRITHYFMPVNVEYSSKNDRFRVHVIHYHKNKSVGNGIINLAQIESTECTAIKLTQTSDILHYKKTAKIKIFNQRNAVNRFMMEFAELERVSEYDESAKQCFVTIKYDVNDETEILIRLMSFGPFIEIVEPLDLRMQIQERVKKQLLLFKDQID